MQQGIKIHKFDPSTIKDDRIILFVGKVGSGKSVLQRDIMRAMRRRFDFGCAMSVSQESLDNFARVMPPSWIHRGYQPSVVAAMIDCQRRALADHKTCRRLFLVLDDVLTDKKAFKSSGVCRALQRGVALPPPEAVSNVWGCL